VRTPRVLVATLAEYHVEAVAARVHGLVIGYAGEPPDRLRAGLEVVAAALETTTPARGRRTDHEPGTATPRAGRSNGPLTPGYGRGMSEPAALPVPDYDHLTVGDLAHRIRSLEADDLETLLAYEREHADRLPIVQELSVRLEQVRSGARMSDGDASAPSAQAAPPADSGSPVQPATSGPAINPPSHGVPTNPAQPRPSG
jgi:hypothetical protein